MAETIPVALIVDDPPINSTYWFRRQMEEAGIDGPPRHDFARFVADWPRQEPSAIIPNAFWRKFAEWSRAEGVKGKFSLLPCPAGLGHIDESVEGYTAAELSEMLGIVREELMGPYDITPEVWTHTLGWNVKERRLEPKAEHDFMAAMSIEQLTDYMAGALEVLVRVGVQPTGITQPFSNRGDESVLARAVLASIKRVTGRTRTFYFLDADGESPRVEPALRAGSTASGQWVVSVKSVVRPDEPFWQSLYGEGDVKAMAEYFISEDGRRGRLVEMVEAGCPAVFHCHGQTIFSNGTEKGLRSLQLVVDRINRHLCDRVTWMTTQDVAEWWMERRGDT